MSLDQLDHYRRLIEIREDLRDPLVMIKVQDLRALLDCYEWYADPTNKPRVRRQAIKETTP